MGATPAAPVAAGVAFLWRRMPSRQPRLRKCGEPDALPQPAGVGPAKLKRRRSRLPSTLRPDHWALQASLYDDLPHVEAHAPAERAPPAVQHPELPCPERIARVSLGDADHAGLEPVSKAWPRGRGGSHDENGREGAQHQQGGDPSRTKRACREHASSSPAATRLDATSRRAASSPVPESAQLPGANPGAAPTDGPPPRRAPRNGRPGART
jgi:hypothetical protein